MIQLVCINAGKLVSKDSSIAYGTNLIKGKLYTATHKTISCFGDECYHILETGDVKQCVRFKEITKRQKEEINKAIERIIEF